MVRGPTAFDALPARREQRLRPAFRTLFEAARASSDIDADSFLDAAASLCVSAPAARPEHAQRLVTLLVQGLRTAAEAPQAQAR